MYWSFASKKYNYWRTIHFLLKLQARYYECNASPPHLPFKYCSVWKISNVYIIYNFLPIVQVSGYLWPRKIVISLRFQTKTITKPNLESLHVSIL